MLINDKMSRFLFCSTQVSPPLQPFPLLSPSSLKNKNPNPNFFRTTKPYTTLLTKNLNPISNASGSESSSITTDENDDAPCVSSCKNSSSGDQLPETSFGDGVEIKIEKPGKNSRKITARIRISAGLETIWKILTDYERLADFLPGLASSELLERGGNWVRLFQIGQQNLGFGLKFNAKAIVDCFEKDLEYLPFGLRRDIEFRLVEGDFQTFDGIWSIIQVDGNTQNDQLLEINETILLYTLDVEPKLWLPVGFVEGIICKEIDVNLQCIRERAQRMEDNYLDTAPTLEDSKDIFGDVYHAEH